MNEVSEEIKLPDYIKIVMHPGESPALVMMVEPNDGTAGGLTAEDLRQIIKEQGVTHWYINEDQIQLFEIEQHSVKETKGFRIAERRDARVVAQVSSDGLESRVSISPPFGGQPVSRENILAALESAGVKFGILESAIPGLVAQGQCREVVMARGVPPQPGEDARIEPLIQESEHKGRPGERQDGSVDYHDLGLFLSVIKGAPLLRKIPLTPGIPGTAVDGSPLPPKPGRDRDFKPGPGTEISREDPNILIAAMGGQPVINDNTAKILGKLELDAVNYETGNIDFDGSLHIRGTIQAGFHAKAGGDILIGDTVELADLSAGGSIVFRCGVFGQKQTHIIAKGNIRAKFLNECIVYCEGNIEVEDLIANCSIICEGMVEVGQKGGKGQVYGGRIIATKGVRAKILGSVTEMTTLVEVSASPTLLAREQQVLKEIKKHEQNLDDVAKSLSYLKRSLNHRNDPRIDSFTEAFYMLTEQLDGLKQELQELSEKLQVETDAKIMASQAHPGVVVSIGSHRKAISSVVQSFCFDHTSNPAVAPHPGKNRN